jgi:outer membrane protein TolC
MRQEEGRKWGRVRLALVMVLWGTPVAALGEPAPGLAASIRATLEGHPELGALDASVALGEANLQLARAPFDHVLESSVGHTHTVTPLAGSAGSPSVLDQTDLLLELGTSTRRGTQVSPWLSIGRVGAWTASESAASAQGSAGLSVTQPLLRGRGLEAAAAGENAATFLLEAAQLNAGHRRGLLVLSTVEAFWALRTAQESLGIVEDAHRRARTLLEETRVLVASDERPAADLDQAAASVADAQALVVKAKSTVFSSQHLLGFAMGLPLDEARTLGRIEQPFPQPDPAAIEALKSVDALVAEALRARRDLRALERAVHSAAVLRSSAKRNTAPGVWLGMDVGYTGLRTGNEVSDMLASLGTQVEGVNGGMRLAVELPLENRSAESLLTQQLAHQRIAEIRYGEAVRSTGVGVATAVNRVETSLGAFAAAQVSSTSYERTLQAEQAKLRSGMATLIDVVLTENQLTRAYLAQLAARQEVALAMAHLTYQLGKLPLDPEQLGTPEMAPLLTGVRSPK